MGAAGGALLGERVGGVGEGMSGTGRGNLAGGRGGRGEHFFLNKAMYNYPSHNSNQKVTD